MEILKIVVGVAVAIFGWSIANYYAQKRDVANKRRELRIASLTEAYKVFVRTGINGVMLSRDKFGNLNDGAKCVEDALAIVHLYGTQSQSKLASKYAENVAKNNTGSLTALVDSIRKDIREDIGGVDLEETPKYIQITIEDREKA